MGICCHTLSADPVFVQTVEENVENIKYRKTSSHPDIVCLLLSNVYSLYSQSISLETTKTNKPEN